MTGLSAERGFWKIIDDLLAAQLPLPVRRELRQVPPIEDDLAGDDAAGMLQQPDDRVSR